MVVKQYRLRNMVVNPNASKHKLRANFVFEVKEWLAAQFYKQHPTPFNKPSSLHYWPAPMQHMPMSPAHAAPATKLNPQIWEASAQQAPMSSCLANTHLANSRVSIAGQHPLSTHHSDHRMCKTRHQQNASLRFPLRSPCGPFGRPLESILKGTEVLGETKQ